MPVTIESEVRTPLATALGGVVASVYNGIPEALIAPAVCLIPDAPYLESTLVNGATTKVKINLTIAGVVAYNNNAAALDNLEQLMISILGAMPSGYVVGDVNQPTPLEVGTGKFLIAELSVSTYYTE
ncbi:hypothetical protein UFOVP874_12 [uncultured Caudovirales phage]|uniref:Uncharacterized protein n=1 Tax=uncultured Caudovirales phage TaxID=2100421 RepID=A0A6J5PGC2_9CAUD|nr:hypothetical protein UFOVP874_12 [uncultured Caudovirales phage]